VKHRTLIRLSVVVLLLFGCAAGGAIAFERSRNPDRLLRLGREAIGREEWDRADDYADRLIAYEHRDYGRLLRGESLYKQHRPGSSIEMLNRVRDEALLVEVARTQGQCLLELGFQREAERVFHYVLNAQPNDLVAYRGLAKIAYDQGNWLHAEAYLKKLAELTPDDGRPLWTLGLIHNDLGLHPQAEQFFRDALARTLPGDLPGLVRADLAMSLNEQKRFEEALEELDRAELAIVTPKQARIRIDSLRSTGRVAEAIAQADVFLAQRPDDAGLLAEKGLALVDAKRPAEAAAALEQALSTMPHDRRGRDGLRAAYQSLGRTADAAIQKDKRDESDRLYKALSGLTHEAMDKPWDASVRWKMADLCDQLQMPQVAAEWRKAARECEGK
jgi:tetratricopeptide (TPR) repeat protein